MLMNFDVKPDFKYKGLIAYDYNEKVGIGSVSITDSADLILQTDGMVDCDWIVDYSSLYFRRVLVGDYVVCELGPFATLIPLLKNNIFLFTGSSWIYLEDRTVCKLLVEGVVRSVFIGSEFTYDELLENTCLQAALLTKGFISVGSVCHVDIAYARCQASMALLDDKHRDYIQTHDYKRGDIIVVKAGAGSGKTTTQLSLAKKHKGKRILYLAFNKSLVSEIEGKVLEKGITNMTTLTFDALLRRAFIKVKGRVPEITDLKPATIAGLVPWLQGKNYKLKNYYCKNFSRFCSDVLYTDMKAFCLEVLGKPVKILEDLWHMVLDGSLITFDAIRKLCFIGHWFKQSIDQEYDEIFVDEIQDFDMAMLRMLLDDTTLPKLFVGDPRQSIYEWRGCINAFSYMPCNALTLEFYSTFRIGEPALSEICSRFADCYMMSKASHSTHLTGLADDDKYVYLFRSWRQLLTTARDTHGMWICGFEQKIIQMRNLHAKLQFMKGDDDVECEDDLPAFLRSMSSEELDELICDIGRNTVSKEESRIRFYTVHSYKGMEDWNVRVANDVSIKDDSNLYYVAITRGKTKISMDEGVLTIDKEASILDLIMGLGPSGPSVKKISEKKNPKKAVNTVKKVEAVKAVEAVEAVKAVKAVEAVKEEEKKVSKVKLWSQEEDALLLNRIQDKTYESIAEELGRSVLGIEFRLRKLGLDLVNSGKTIDEAITITKLDRIIIEEAQDEQKIKEAATRKGKRWDDAEISKILGLVKTGTSVNKIALICGRSVGAIKEKLCEQARKLNGIGFSIDDIIKTTGLDSTEVGFAISKKNTNN